MEIKKPYVQMPKPNNDDAVKLLTDLVTTVRYMAPRSNGVNRAYYAAKEYLAKIGVIETEKLQPRPSGGKGGLTIRTK